LSLSRTQIVVAHLALYATGVDSVATGNHSLFQQLVEDGFMKRDLLLRGE
jgi:calcineurin-like phosphoesterase